VIVTYIISAGESGNFEENDFPEFQFISGVFNARGEEIDIKEHCTIVKDSGFLLGSDGEDIDTLRYNVGYNSRSLVLAHEKNFASYLSRLSTISRVRVWTDADNTAVKKLFMLPDIESKIRNYTDYLSLDEKSFVLSDEFKKNIISMIEDSRRTYVTNELIFIDALVRKYALFIYIDNLNNIVDTNSLKEKVVESVIKTTISRTFTKSTDPISLPKSLYISNLYRDVDGLERVTINILSASNEEAKINGYYNETVEVVDNGVTRFVNRRVNVQPGIDPIVGLTEYNDISLKEEYEIPLIAGHFNVLSSDGTIHTLYEPIHVFVKENNDWKLI